MPRRLHLLWSLPLLLIACKPDTIELGYRFPEGVREYRMEVAARALWDIGGPGRGSYRWVADVSEEVTEDEGATAVVEVTMSPVQVEEEELSSPGTQERTFKLRIDRAGGVVAVLEVNGVDATQLSPEDVAFIGTFRPALPADPVALRDEWESEQRGDGGTDSQQLPTTGRLESLYRDADGPVAEVTYSGSGPLEWEARLPLGSSRFTGSAGTAGSASFDIEDGVLRSASSSLDGEFQVRVIQASGAGTPVTGTMQLDLDLRVSAKD
jgi:hypothetical protein